MKKLIFVLSVLVGSWGNAQQLLEVLKSSSSNIPPINLPPNVKLGGGTTFIASIYDEDYLPYEKPNTPAVWTNVPADNIPEAKVIDYQGTLTETGKTIYIPITATGNATIPAYTSAPISIDTYKTEDGQSRQVILSWEAQSITADTKMIKAQIKTIKGELKVKKLDLNGGLGSDNKGLLLASFIYPSSNTDNTTSTYEVRAISGIPDRHFKSTIITPELVRKVFNIPDSQPLNLPDLSFMNREYIYTPIATPDGKIWLNNNLGAAYSDVNSEHFNPAQQAQSDDDFRAFGHLFQWQRPADGHERFYWTGPREWKHSLNVSTIANQYMDPDDGNSAFSLKERHWAPHKNYHYLGKLLNGKEIYRFMPNDNYIFTYPVLNASFFWSKLDYESRDKIELNLWQAGGRHNPCPEGFHVPTHKEFRNLIMSITNNEIDNHYANRVFYLSSNKISLVRNIIGGLISRGILGIQSRIIFHYNVLWMSDVICDDEYNNTLSHCALPKFVYETHPTDSDSEFEILGIGQIHAYNNDVSAQVRCIQD